MSTLKARRSTLLKETVHETQLEGGMRALIHAKPGFVKKAAMVLANYGSLDTVFDADGAGPKSTPEGIAHFLEHQLFKKQRGDLLMEYGRFGASANAFTYYNATVFFFTTSGEFEPSLDVLLETVFTPWFSEEGVAKEKSIIEQELKMYLDAPERVIYRRLMEILYRRHPVRNDIGGTVASIQDIDARLLERCWRTFYHPSNLIFVAAGDVDPTGVLARVSKTLKKAGKARPPIARVYEREPRGVGAPLVDGDAVISRPQILLGIKDLVVGNEQALERDLASTVALDLLFGRGSEWFQERYESGLIDDSFSFGYTSEDTFGFSMIGGETGEPERLADDIRQEIARARKSTFSKGDVERSKRKRLGRYLRSFNAPDETAFLFMGYAQRDLDPFAVPGIIEGLTPAALKKRVNEHLTEDNLAVSILRPRKP